MPCAHHIRVLVLRSAVAQAYRETDLEPGDPQVHENIRDIASEDPQETKITTVAITEDDDRPFAKKFMVEVIFDRPFIFHSANAIHMRVVLQVPDGEHKQWSFLQFGVKWGGNRQFLLRHAGFTFPVPAERQGPRDPDEEDTEDFEHLATLLVFITRGTAEAPRKCKYDMCEHPAVVDGFKRLPGTNGKTYCFEYSYVTETTYSPDTSVSDSEWSLEDGELEGLIMDKASAPVGRPREEGTREPQGGAFSDAFPTSGSPVHDPDQGTGEADGKNAVNYRAAVSGLPSNGRSNTPDMDHTVANVTMPNDSNAEPDGAHLGTAGTPVPTVSSEPGPKQPEVQASHKLSISDRRVDVDLTSDDAEDKTVKQEAVGQPSQARSMLREKAHKRKGTHGGTPVAEETDEEDLELELREVRIERRLRRMKRTKAGSVVKGEH